MPIDKRNLKLPENRIDFSEIIKAKGISSTIRDRKIVSTKANTLSALKPLLKRSRIEDLYVFTAIDWKNNPEKEISCILEKFGDNKLVIRSSAITEDTIEESKAGYFESVLDVYPKKEDIHAGINKVIASYKRKGQDSSFNQVLVQKQSKNIAMSGVIFTRTLSNYPYYVINYDDKTGKTDTVTAGTEGKTIYLARSAKSPSRIAKLMESVKEIEEIIPGIGLDIEFGIDDSSNIIIFQARPLAISHKGAVNEKGISTAIMELKQKFIYLCKPKSHLAGQRTILGDMPDWNPAEIIGDKPNRLDYSLYDYLITDSAWHKARSSQGYYDVSPAKLVVLLGNKPYVDARNSFNSFVPAKLPKTIREKLVSFYLNKLENNHDMQDKVEFEILFTCYDLLFDKRSIELKNAGFTETEIESIRDSLLDLTNNLVNNYETSIARDMNSLKIMEKNRQKISDEIPLTESVINLLHKAKLLLDDARTNGTVQFSRLARLGFIGKIILESMVARGIIDKEVYNKFMNSITTVATEINSDFAKLCENKISKEDFIKKYYHLRPGTYDITSPRYDSNPDLLNSFNMAPSKHVTEEFKPSLDLKKKITLALKDEGLDFDADALFMFARNTLEARELSKFEFTKNLSEALEIIAMAGKEMGFSRKELAMLEVSDLFSLESMEEISLYWKQKIALNTENKNLYSGIILPPIIASEKDLEVIIPYRPRPNYITNKKVSGKAIKLIDKANIPDIVGKIVLIESGDPGYDWVFTRKIAGLITKYGGVASHMSIRSAEFGIPAAIGSGYLFDQINDGDNLTLDCEFGRILK